MVAAHRPSHAAGSTLTLRLHGTPRIAGPDGHETVLERRAAALCALAALQPGFPREAAAAWLWPDSGDGRRNLRQQLLRFKRQHGHAVLAGDERLHLAEGVVFEDADELLPDQPYEDCEAFAQWLQAQRDARRRGRMAAHRQALAQAEAAGDLAAALAAAEALVAAEPGSEEPLRELMRVHYLRADAAAGLAVHQRLLRMLASEHGARPSAATEQLALALRQAQPAATPALRSISPTLLRPPRMVGRLQEQRAVLEAWAAGQAALVLGEPGMGKSRLMADCCAGLCTASVAGRPGDAMSPFATLARLLRPLQPVAEQALPAAARRQLAHLMPLHDAPALPDLQAGALEQATATLLLHAGVAAVAVDDLHFADAASVDLLAALAEAAPAGQRWLFAQRPAETTPAIQALRDALEAAQRLARIALAPLDEAAMGELVDTLGIEGLHGGALAPTLVRHTGGNPLFVLETLKQGLFDGSLARGELPRPGTVGALIERRLQRLSPRALTLARVAAVAGVDFCIELAEEAIGVRAVELAGAWDELQLAQVLRDEAFAHDLVADAVQRGIPSVVARRMHAQCAQWLEARHGDPARNAWHWWHADEAERAATAFEASASRAAAAGRRREEADLYAQAAAGWARAGMPDKAFQARADRIDALTRADFGPLALQEARELQALAVDDTQRLRAARTEIDLLANRGQAADVLPRAREALALARRLGLPGEQLAISGPLAGCLTLLGRAEEAHDVLKLLQPWIEASAEPLQKQVWFGYMATALLDLGQIAEAVRLREAQLAIALQLDVKPVAVVAYNHLGVAHGARGFPRPAIAACRQAVALCAQMPGDVTRTSLARLTLARQLSDDAAFGEAIEILEQVLAHFKSAGSVFWTEAAALALAGLWIRLGQPARAQGLLDRDETQLASRQLALRRLLALELAAALGRPVNEHLADEACAAMPGDMGQALATRAAALRARPHERAFAESEDVLRLLRRHERRGGEAAAWVWRARAATALQRHDEACHAAQRLGELLAQDCAPEGMYRGEAYLQAWQSWAAAGQADAARQALHAGVAWVQQRALPQVPPAFVDGFLHRQQANRSLLAALGRAA